MAANFETAIHYVLILLALNFRGPQSYVATLSGMCLPSAAMREQLINRIRPVRGWISIAAAAALLPVLTAQTAVGADTESLNQPGGSSAALSAEPVKLLSRPVLRPGSRIEAVRFPVRRPQRRGASETVNRTAAHDDSDRVMVAGMRAPLLRPENLLIPRGPAALAAADGTTLARPQRRPSGKREINCLAQAIYFEARSENLAGRIAVAETILNRVASERYPDTVCAVIRQGMELRHRCQFSYNCDGKAEIITEFAAYAEIRKLARRMLSGAAEELTDGATHFHTVDVNPPWARKFVRTASIGRHLFYRGNR